MKVLASLKPYFYYLVGEGIKKWEIRKGCPKSKDWDRETYFYMSKDEKSFSKIPKEFQEKYRKHFGKVGLKFVCDEIKRFECSSTAHKELATYQTCLTFNEILDYCNGQDLYAWHISDLKIYDQPKEIWEFFTKGECDTEICYKCPNYRLSPAWYAESDCMDYSLKPLTRPFQSWGYINA